MLQSSRGPPPKTILTPWRNWTSVGFGTRPHAPPLLPRLDQCCRLCSAAAVRTTDQQARGKKVATTAESSLIWQQDTFRYLSKRGGSTCVCNDRDGQSGRGGGAAGAEAAAAQDAAGFAASRHKKVLGGRWGARTPGPRARVPGRALAYWLMAQQPSRSDRIFAFFQVYTWFLRRFLRFYPDKYGFYEENFAFLRGSMCHPQGIVLPGEIF